MLFIYSLQILDTRKLCSLQKYFLPACGLLVHFFKSIFQRPELQSVEYPAWCHLASTGCLEGGGRDSAPAPTHQGARALPASAGGGMEDQRHVSPWNYSPTGELKYNYVHPPTPLPWGQEGNGLENKSSFGPQLGDWIQIFCSYLAKMG